MNQTKTTHLDGLCEEYGRAQGDNQRRNPLLALVIAEHDTVKGDKGHARQCDRPQQHPGDDEAPPWQRESCVSRRNINRNNQANLETQGPKDQSKTLVIDSGIFFHARPSSTPFAPNLGTTTFLETSNSVQRKQTPSKIHKYETRHKVNQPQQSFECLESSYKSQSAVSSVHKQNNAGHTHSKDPQIPVFFFFSGMRTQTNHHTCFLKKTQAMSAKEATNHVN